MTYTDRSENAARPRSWFEPPNKLGDVSGIVFTPDGIVEALSGTYRGGWSRLTACRDGRRYTRRFDRQYKRRRLVTLAARFAREIAGGGP